VSNETFQHLVDVGEPVWLAPGKFQPKRVGGNTSIQRSTSHQTDPNIGYVFAKKNGVPTNPDWYYNLTTAGNGTVERGTETYEVTVREVTGAERDRIYAEQARRYPSFAECERHTAGIRIVPVLELRRA
jgi:deazaflavin-dependent oxidoreductase (nitroreductase family)